MELFVKKAIGTLLVMGLLTAAAFARPDLNAFINRKVETTAQLVAEARNDKSVMDRYQRHYGMSRAEVLEYLGSLKPDTIKEEGVYAVYSVPEGGRIKLHMERLKKGHKVFSSPDGEPQLILKCGNPLTMGPKSVVAVNQTPVTTTEVMVEETPLEIMTSIETETEPLMALEPAEPKYTLVTPPTEEETAIPIAPLAGGFNPLPLALGGLVFLDNGGDSSQPVPEPMTMAVFGAGIAYMGLRKRRKAAK